MLDGVRRAPAPSPLSETHFESEPILSAAEQEAAARGPAYFTPEPMAPPAPAPAAGHEAEAESTATEAMVSAPLPMDSYIEVEDGVELLTEDERVAMLEARARVRGPRKYMQFAEASNTGAVLQRYPKQSIRSCMRLCEFDSRCVGFTAMRDPKHENGVCTLRSAWGSNIDNPKKDSYQVIGMYLSRRATRHPPYGSASPSMGAAADHRAGRSPARPFCRCEQSTLWISCRSAICRYPPARAMSKSF
jgi:hypothetical protein